MSLNNIKLSPFLLKQMYQYNLVSTSFATNDVTQVEPTHKQEKTTSKKTNKNENNFVGKFPILGKNAQHILIYVFDEKEVFLSDDDLSFLIKILSACGKTMADVALVNCANKTIDRMQLKEELSPKNILFFGIEPQQLDYPLGIPHFKVQIYSEQQFLVAPPIKELIHNPEQKKLLWVALKDLFNV